MNKISHHEARFFRALQSTHNWLSSKDLAEIASISSRTARMYARKFGKLGVIETASVFPGHRYRLNRENLTQEASGYIAQIKAACEVFDI